MNVVLNCFEEVWSRNGSVLRLSVIDCLFLFLLFFEIDNISASVISELGGSACFLSHQRR